MNITNNSSDFFILNVGHSANILLPPGESVEIDNSMYTGNTSLKNKIDALSTSGKIVVTGFEDLFPESGKSSDAFSVFPPSYDVSDRDFIITKEDATVGVAINEDEDGLDHGYVRLEDESGSKVGLSSWGEDDTTGMFFADKNADDEQKFFDLREDGAKLTLDASSVTAEDIANFLIDLGLAEGA